MPTEEERREVARKLREANVRREFYSPWCRMVESVLDGTDCGEDDGTCDENACCEKFMKRMADLIEPSGHECVPGECPLNVRHDNDHIDRDALVALADDIDKQTDGSMFDAWLEDGHYIARRIREACGEGER